MGACRRCSSDLRHMRGCELMPEEKGKTHMANNFTVLRVACLAGALTDALAIVPMLSPSVAALLWGIEEASPAFRFAAASAAALMLGWTILLLWAYRRPAERRAIAIFTIIVVAGLAVAEVFAVQSSVVSAARMAPTWFLQAGLCVLFAVGLVQSRPERTRAA